MPDYVGVWDHTEGLLLRFIASSYKVTIVYAVSYLWVRWVQWRLQAQLSLVDVVQLD